MDYNRDKFEQYAAQMGKKDFELNEFGDYRNPFTQEPWDFWRASRDSFPAAAAPHVPQAVLEALRFYAHGHHYNIDDDHQQFDTVSGEPPNWLHSERDDDCTMIEDGSIARAALCGGAMGWEEPMQPVEGEVLIAAPTPTVAADAAAPIMPPHDDDAAVERFAAEMKAKLSAARAKGRSGWQQCAPEDLSRMLREHVEKGDPRDVANFCMFLWSLEAPISKAAQPDESAAFDLPPLPAPLEIDWPELHSQALGCGVEDRNIRDRYEAAEYGWQDGAGKASECVPEEIFTADQMREYALAAVVRATAPQATVKGDERASEVYAECRQCDECGHIGINDSHETDAACGHSCGWRGPSPEEDKCPGCGNTNVMSIACPKCSSHYNLLAEARLPARAAIPQASFDIEAMLKACVPGGNICDPQVIADSLREWFAARATAPQAKPLTTGYCKEGENHCVCGGDLPRVREGCGNWVKGNLPDASIAACTMMIKGICMTHPQDQWSRKIEERIRCMLGTQP